MGIIDFEDVHRVESAEAKVCLFQNEKKKRKDANPLHYFFHQLA